ncbi:cryptochrome/photolyase family protein [Roseisalinus antarcticus]|uniref:Deoxyribodipyrimidine photo-lyase n=1 Tax=Roseisalinus antarcticus TaxID=254357 RepID=A0A1Y5TZ79_9RHOB|nr:deoxyribodipyrimidine photo-lyase [Roseisalinus antarcticus]SLN71852.1 Deoxyribodipyrimidine photo-lyase [Roseisalinus antarcticus]
MADASPILLWFRRDLRLADHPALAAAAETGRPIVPVFIHDQAVEGHGAAARWRLGRGVAAFAAALEDKGSTLVLRRGEALQTLRGLVRETGAGAVWWTRLYDSDARKRDEAVKAGLKDDGLDARSFAGHLLFEPWTVETRTGGFYKVYTPMWKAVRGRDPGTAAAAPSRLSRPESFPESDALDDWRMAAPMNRGAAVVAPHLVVGEAAARDRLDTFIDDKIADYDEARDIPAIDGTSGLSENLALGEIGPRTCWEAGWRALDAGAAGAETFLKELVWREFAYHLVHHTPRLTTGNWREEWDAFPWNEDETRPEVLAWKQGRTGMEFVDAAMREMHVTGRMHNRGRMIVASYLTKHLMTHWRIGLRWFEEHLIDWDPASNAMGWQWSAGSGPDATPYFRVFNPETQVDKFDRDGEYRRRWIAEGQGSPPRTALDYFEAIPRCWGLGPGDGYPDPVVSAKDGRRRALDAYSDRDF